MVAVVEGDTGVGEIETVGVVPGIEVTLDPGTAASDVESVGGVRVHAVKTIELIPINNLKYFTLGN